VGIDPNDPLLTRDWASVAAAKTERWLARKKSATGALEGLRIGAELRAHARLIHPNWPSDESRAADLENHQRLARLLRVDLRRR
jgi:hypothetical protein